MNRGELIRSLHRLIELCSDQELGVVYHFVLGLLSCIWTDGGLPVTPSPPTPECRPAGVFSLAEWPPCPVSKIWEKPVKKN